MHARKVAITAVLGILVVLLLSSAVPARAADGGLSGMYGGDLRVAVRSALDLNPFTATDAESWKVIPLAYDSLARIDPTTLVPVPWAAESWSISGDELTVELRSDLQFHDGSAVTAADVIYSYNEYKAGGMVASDLAVTAAGSTLTMSSATAGGLLYGQYLTLPIVKSGTSAAPVGGGPWELTDETASSWTLTANADHFWPPYLETVTFSVYADTVSAGADLLRGDIDFIGWTLGVDEPTTVIDVDGVNQTLLADSTILATPGLQQLAFGFNVDPAQPTSDDALRLALARTLNPILFQQIYPNTLRSRSPIIEEDLPWFNPNVPVYQVLVYTAGAPARSTAYLTPSLQLLDAGGYVDRDGDGWREDPTGAQLTLTVVGIPVTEDARQFTIQEASVDIFTRMGVRAFLVSVASSQIEARIASGDYDVFINRFWSALDPGFMWDYLHSAGASNVFGVDNAALDGYLDEANAALDPASRATAAWRRSSRR
jgi:peptide/nickel transport system substrate-binding protein